MGTLEDVFTAAFHSGDPLAEAGWVEWKHVQKGLTHCETCLKLDACWFLHAQMPTWPHHPHCHCVLVPVEAARVERETTAGCVYSKLDPYLFDPENVYHHGKQKMFESWGYSIADSEWLRQEFERQGMEKYITGEYTLGKLDKYGQRINTRIELPRKDKNGAVSFMLGWMVEANGHIQLNTPYGVK